jgi:hypothetical protein
MAATAGKSNAAAKEAFLSNSDFLQTTQIVIKI